MNIALDLSRPDFNVFESLGSKRDLAVLLQMIMCACILHNLLINHAIPEDWLEAYSETDDDVEHDNERANRRDLN